MLLLGVRTVFMMDTFPVAALAAWPVVNHIGTRGNAVSG